MYKPKKKKRKEKKEKEKDVQTQKEEKKREKRKRKRCTNPKAEMTKSHLMRDICSGSSIHLKESIDKHRY